MTNKFRLLPLAVLFSLSLIACKKEAGSNSDSNAYNSVVETKPAVQKPVSVNVNGNIGGYQEALPALYDSTTKKYPLLIFVHGVGELGNGVSDLWMAANIGTPGLIKNGKFPPAFNTKNQSFSFIVIAPQFKAWPSSADMDAMVNYAINKYRVDTNRIYVSGLSMGGGATWEYAAAYSNKIAAIAPICGAAGPNDAKAQKLVQAGVKVWAFHNQDDGVVSVNNSTGWVNKYNSFSPSVAAKITLWPSGGHDAWTKATDPNFREGGLNVYEWMLQYEK
jgi:predicted peptidase